MLKPIKRFLSYFVGFVVVTTACIIQPIQAQVDIQVTSGQRRALPIAVTDLRVDDANVADIAHDLPQLIRENLQKTGLLKLLGSSAFPQSPNQALEGVDFNGWSVDKTQALMTGSLSTLSDGRMQANIWLYDVPQRKEIFALSYSATSDSWRRIGHIIADEIYVRLTGEAGLFDSRIVYVSESGPSTRRIKRLAIMDQDGGNHRFLTDGSQLVLTPRFSPTRQEITYISYEAGRPQVQLLNLATGHRETLGDFPGRTMTFAPRFSPDGQSVILSLALEGNTDIYVMNLQTRQVRQLTRDSAIDTSPSYSPDGKRIVFNSDRGGSQQIYVMNADGSGVQRISFGAGIYATPVWSPKGDKIAFTRILDNDFAVGIMDTDGFNERLISTGFLVEGPEWSPNGRILTYFKQDRALNDESAGRTRLFMVDTFSFLEREIPTPADASDPAWSPLLPR
ncbi:MAG: Tol-Pal system beta propeller repeat protein TolB [Alphaproteobacteria bacterium]